MRGRDLPSWPAWCHAPIAAGVAAVTGGATSPRLTPDLARDAAAVTALAAWRQTKGVYRFDQDLLEALWSTPVTGDLPSQVLHRLPEWCVYVPLDRPVAQERLYGVWAHLEHDANDGSQELRLLFAAGDELWPVPIALGGSLRAGIDAVVSSALLRLQRPLADRQVDEATRALREAAEPVVSLLLWLCSEQPEITGDGRPENPRPVKTKRGARTFPAAGPRTWEVGARVGAALRAARDAAKRAEGEATGRRVRPHVRRAHWHTYLTGPRSSEQTPVFRWLNPI